MLKNKFVEIGCFVGVHGIKGQLKLKSYASIPEDIFDYDNIYIKDREKIIIELIGKAKTNFICKVNDINSRTDAENIKQLKLFIKRKDLPVIKSDEFYQSDLLDFNVFNKNRDFFGQVITFKDFGGGLLVEVKRENKLFFLPISKNFIVNIDYKQEELILNLNLEFFK